MVLKRILFLQLLCCLVMFPHILFAQTQADATSLPGFNTESTVSFNGSSGDHWWKFSGIADEGITIALTGHFDANYANLYLYDAYGNTVGSTTYIYDGEIQIINVQLGTTGTYYLKITGNAVGNYDLAVYDAWYNAGTVDSDRDFYHSFNTARYLANGSYARSAMPDGTMLDDYHRFSATAGSTVNIELTGHLNANHVNFYLYDAQGTQIAYKQYIDNGETGNLSEAVTVEGVYYLKVSGTSAVGSYELSVTGIEPDVDSDGDGLHDDAEYLYGLNPAAADTDGDGSNDYAELTGGDKPWAADFYTDSQVGKGELTALSIPYRNSPFNAEYIDENGDHWWKFSGIAGEGITIALTGHFDANYANLYLYDAYGNTVGSTTYIYDGEIQIINVQLGTTGTYYLKITGNAVGNYDLAVYDAWYNAGTVDSDRDFYHSFNTARYLANGSYARSAMPDGTMLDDYHRFSATAGSTVNIELTGHLNANHVNFYLYDAQGTQIAYKQYIDNGETGNLSEAVTVEGVYYLKVSGTSAVGSYELSVTGIEPDADSDGDGLHDDAEYLYGLNPAAADTDGDGSNDYAELTGGDKPWAADFYTDSQVGKGELTALSIPYRNSPFNAEYIDENGDHWWKFSGIAGEGITIALTGHFDANYANLYLYDAYGNTVGSTTYIYDGEIQIINVQLGTTGTYYLKITGNAVGNYDLAVYDAWYNAGTVDSDRDFYHSFNTARYLANGSYARSAMPDGTMLDDYHRFSATAGSTVNIELTGHLNANHVNFYLYDAQGTQIAYKQYIDDGETGNLSEAVTVEGVYYLKVSGTNAVGSYELSVTGIEPDADSVTSLRGTPVQTIDSHDPTAPENQYSLVADPIDVSTGAHILTRHLISVQGALPLNMALNYSSLSPLGGVVGYGWNHSFNIYLEEPEAGQVVIYWPTRITTYTLTDGVYMNVDGDAKDCLDAVDGGGFELLAQDKTRYRFNASGELTQTLSHEGFAINYSYADGRVTSVTEPLSGRQILFTYDGVGRLASVSAVDAGTIAFNYDTAGNLIQITDALDESQSYTYDANHRILTGTDELGVVIFANTYDTQGRIIEQEDASTSNLAGTLSYTEATDGSRVTTVYSDRTGASKTYVHDDQYRLISLTDELGNTETYTYDSNGNRTSVTDALGRVIRYYYDLAGNLIQITDPLGNETLFSYDGNDNLTEIVDAKGQSATMEYVDNRLTSVVDKLGNEMSYQYNDDGLLTTTTKALGGTTTYAYLNGQPSSVTDATDHNVTFTYDGAGRLLSITDDEDNATSNLYDLKGQLLRQTDPLGHFTAHTYDAKGRRVSTTDANGNTTTFVYDANNNLISMTDALGGETEFTYDGEDRLKTIVDALGNTIKTIDYDAKGQVVSVTDALGRSQVFEYDVVGNLIGQQAPSGDVTTFTFDVLNRMIRQIDPLGRGYTNGYDAVGNIILQQDPLGRTTSYAYDALNHLLTTDAPLDSTAQQQFNADGLRTGLTDPNGNTLHFDYDAEGRLTLMQSSAGDQQQLSYNNRGLLQQTINGRNQDWDFLYDEAGRLITATGTDDQIEYSYDANGNLLTAVDSSGTVTRTYDALNRVVGFTDIFGNSIGYQYDAAGKLTQLTYPDGKKVSYGYDVAGQLTSVTDWLGRQTEYQYDVNGRLETTIHANGLVTTYGYDAAGQMVQQITRTAGGSEFVGYALAYDANGNITSESGGEVVPLTTGILAMTYGADNCLATFDGQAVQYDNDGNMISGPMQDGTVAGFAYDSRNRLTSVSGTTYGYDAENRRVQTTNANGTTRYVVNPAQPLSQVLMETDQSGSVTAWNVYGLGLIGRQEAAGSYLTYHYDLRGSTVALTDMSQAVTDRYAYGPYGGVFHRQGTAAQPFAYNGRDGVMTETNGLYHMRTRYYSPQAKRFVNRDTLLGDAANTLSLNRYAYVNGNPSLYVDPSGRIGMLVTGAIGAGVSGGWEMWTQLASGTKFSDLEWRKIGGAAAGGFFSGVLGVGFGSIAKTVAQKALYGYAAGAWGSFIDMAISGDDFDGSDFLINAGIGAISAVMPIKVKKGVFKKIMTKKTKKLLVTGLVGLGETATATIFSSLDADAAYTDTDAAYTDK